MLFHPKEYYKQEAESLLRKLKQVDHLDVVFESYL
jgi:hypothetical protein